MKKIFLFIFLLITVFAFGQPSGVPGYTDINNRYNWGGGIFKRFNVPVGTTAALQSGQPGLAGAIYADSTGGDKGLYWYRDGVWIKLADTTYTGFASPNVSIGTGFRIAVDGTNQIKRIDATNGLSLDTNTVANTIIANLGTYAQALAANHMFQTDRWIQTGNSTLSYKLTMQRDISGFGPPYTSYPYTITEFTRPTQIKLAGVDGGNIAFVVYDSAATVGLSNAGLNFYSGFNQTLQAFGPGMHWDVTDKHYDIVDLRGSLTSAQIQSGGVGLMILGTNGISYYNYAIGAKRTRFGSASVPGQTVSIGGSLSNSDSVIFSNLERVTDTTGFDVVMADRSTGNLKKMYAGLIGGGGSGTFEQSLNAGSTLTTDHAVSASSDEFSWTGFSNYIISTDSLYLPGQDNTFVNDTTNRKLLVINPVNGSVSMSNWLGGGGGVTTLGAIGASPNANGATISGSTLNLEPASASFGGVVTTGTQTFAGAKTFSSAPTFSSHTATYLLYAGTGGLVSSSANMAFDGSRAIFGATAQVGASIASGDVVAGASIGSVGSGWIQFQPSWLSGTSSAGVAGRYFNGSAWSTAWEYTNTSGAAATNFLILKSGGKVGIGTASPTEVLTVNGQVKVFAPQADATPDSFATWKNGVLSASNQVIISSTYNPTLTTITNLDGATVSTCQYMRVGDVVTVSGKVTANPTAAGTASFRINFPIASAISATEQCGGVAFAKGIAGLGAEIYADVTNDEAKFEWIAVDITDQEFGFIFQYIIAIP